MISPSNKEVLETKEVAPEEKILENTLRPLSLIEYIGQKNLKANLSIVMSAAKGRNEQMEHVLLYGPPGLGKTTLAHIIAKEFGSNIKNTSGPAIERAGDLASILTGLEEGDVLFIDEIHRMNKIVEEILYPALEDGFLDIILGHGPGARSIRMELPKFTLIGATTRIGMLSNPLRDRFGVVYHLDYYSPEELEQVINRSAKILGIKIHEEASFELAKRSRLTPRIANRVLKRIRDFAQVNGHDTISVEVAREALELLEIDSIGLDKNDRKILEILVDKFSGGPVGLTTLAAATGEEVDTITDVYEPFLIRQGLLNRTPRGRQATIQTYVHLNRPVPKQASLL